MKPKISVVIPAYNVQDYIEKTLNSIVKQTVLPYEIVVVNDASTDHTGSIAKNVLSSHRELDTQVVTHLENQGIGITRQDGVKAAQGDYIAFLSADDFYLPRFLESSMPFLDGKTGTHTDYWRFFMNGKRTKRFSCPKYKTQEKVRTLVIEWALRKNMFIMFSSIIMPKWWFNHIQFEPKLRHGEDLILLLDTIIKGFHWHHIPKPLVYYRIHKKQGTRTLKKHEWYGLWKYNKDRLLQLGVTKEDIDTAQIKNHSHSYPDPLSRVWRKVKRTLKKK